MDELKDSRQVEESNGEEKPPVKGGFLSFLLKPVNKRIPVIIFLVFFISIYLLQDFLIIRQDLGFRFSDAQLKYSLMYYDNFFTPYKSNVANHPYPPLVYLTTLPFYAAFGATEETAYFSLMIYIVIFLLAMFGIGCEMGGYYAGASVMALAASSPRVLYFCRCYYLDFPQTALTALAFYLLLKCRSFTIRKTTILFGIVLALSFLVKWSTAFFLAIPVLWFFIPLPFRSKKTFLTTLVLLAPVIITLLGTAWFMFHITPGSMVNQWYLYYLLIVVIPGVLCLFLTMLREKKLKQESEEVFKENAPIINIAYMSVIFLVLALPWFFHAALPFMGKSLMDAAAGRDFAYSTNYLMTFYKNLFSFAPILLSIGFVFIFTRKEDIYRRLSIPASLILGSLLMIRIGFPAERYILAFIIFAAALGGFWTARTWKFRSVLTGIIVLMSLLSIFWWMAPLETRIKHTEKIEKTGIKLNSGPVEPIIFNLYPVITYITPNVNYEPTHVIIYQAPDFSFHPEHFITDAHRFGKRMDLVFGGSINSMEQLEIKIRDVGDESESVRKTRRNMEQVTDIIIFHKSDSPWEPVASRMIGGLFPIIPYKPKKFDIGGGFSITVLKLERN